MKLNESKALIRDAKFSKNNLGMTFYSVVVNPNTGVRSHKTEWTHGMPGRKGGIGPREAAVASTVGILSIASLYRGIDLLRSSKIGDEEMNKRQAFYSGVYGLAALVGFGTLLPFDKQLSGTPSSPSVGILNVKPANLN